MLNPETEPRVDALAPLFAALGDTTRLQLLTRLSDGQQYSIAQLSSGLHLTRQGVTKHLQVMEEAGIVASSRSGRENRFMFTPNSVNAMQSYLSSVGSQWESALARLQGFVEP